MWRVYFKFLDLEGNVISCNKDFDNEKEATKFYNHIKEITKEMILKYGKLGRYHPYFDIRIREV